MTDPSSILTAAADRVRDLAAAATGGPWETIGDTGGIWREASPKRAVRTSPGYLGSMEAAENARWIAALSPATAAPIEAMFRFAALAHQMDNAGTQDENALALARAVLGEDTHEAR